MAESMAPPSAGVEERVLAVVRELVAETGGDRAVRAVAPQASLERDLGLGSLERVELLLRLENAFGRSLTDASLEVDTPAGLAEALGAVLGTSGDGAGRAAGIGTAGDRHARGP